MAAALVTGLIPILRSAVETSTTYKARTLWFGLLAVRLVVLFVTELPWFKLDVEFSCNNTTLDSFCTRACYNQHFDRPAVVAWNFLFVVLVISVLLMDVFSAKQRSNARKQATKISDNNVEAPVAGLMRLDLHASRCAVCFYLLSVVLRITVEIAFLYVLLKWNLPKMNGGQHLCKIPQKNVCPGPQLCLVRGAPEKCMSIIALASIFSLVIVSSVLFFLYAVMHYLCNCGGKSPKKSQV